MASVVYVPLSRAQAGLLAQQGSLIGPLQGFSANQALRATFEVSDEEEAELAALQIASVWGLCVHGVRLIIAVDGAQTGPGGEADNGGVVVEAVPLHAVTAWFSDQATLDGTESDLVRGQELEAAWAEPQVQALLAEDELMWHAVGELPGIG